MRPIDADALMANCQLAQKQANRHGREFANAFYSGSGDISTEWWCVEDIIENAPTIEPARKKGKWIPQDMNKSYGRISTAVYYYPKCSVCGWSADNTNFCPNCGADMRGGET